MDVYLPDGSGIDFVRELRCDSMVLSAATDAPTIRAAVAAGALSYLVKPFAPAELAARLAGYARYRKILSGTDLGAKDVEAALDALRPRRATAVPQRRRPPPNSLSCRRCAQRAPMSSAEVSAEIGVSRATAQRYLATLAPGRSKPGSATAQRAVPRGSVAVDKLPNRSPR